MLVATNCSPCYLKDDLDDEAPSVHEQMLQFLMKLMSKIQCSDGMNSQIEEDIWRCVRNCYRASDKAEVCKRFYELYAYMELDEVSQPIPIKSGVRSRDALPFKAASTVPDKDRLFACLNNLIRLNLLGCLDQNSEITISRNSKNGRCETRLGVSLFGREQVMSPKLSLPFLTVSQVEEDKDTLLTRECRSFSKELDSMPVEDRLKEAVIQWRGNDLHVQGVKPEVVKWLQLDSLSDSQKTELVDEQEKFRALVAWRIKAMATFKYYVAVILKEETDSQKWLLGSFSGLNSVVKELKLMTERVYQKQLTQFMTTGTVQPVSFAQKPSNSSKSSKSSKWWG
ncbi:MAG: hypothetical protein ACPGUD_06010 [Parashewanella sp.]